MSLLKSLVLIGGAIAQVPAGDTVTDWNNIANLPSTFPPAVHSHVMADVTDLAAALALKAPLASPNFNSGNLTVSAGHIIIDRVGDAAFTQFQIKGDAGFARDIGFYTGNALRWTLRTTSGAEGGSNAGSDFQLVNYNDAGTALSAAISIVRATGIATFAASPLFPTPTAGDNTTKGATTAFVTTAIGNAFAANDALLFKGTIDASGNPNYPAADAGNVYRISVAGKIGGASGPNVEIGDTLYALVDGSAAGNHATVGANWQIVQSNLDGAVIGPASVTSGNPVVFNGTTGKLVQEVTFAAFRTSLGLAAIAVSGSASDLSSGTVPDARISGDYLNFAKIVTSGQVEVGANLLITGLVQIGTGIMTNAANLDIRQNTADAADNAAVRISGGGGVSSITRGGYINLHGNEHATFPGRVVIASSTLIQLSATSGIEFTGDIVHAANNVIRRNTADGADTGQVIFTGGGAYTGSTDRGAFISLYGNEHASSAGQLRAASATSMTFTTPVFTINGDIHYSGLVVYTAPTNFAADTVDGSDNSGLSIGGGGSVVQTRGAYIQVFGNENSSSPGALNLVAGLGALSIIGGSQAAAFVQIRPNTADAADSGLSQIGGGGAFLSSRGAMLQVYGNEHGTLPGQAVLTAGTSGSLVFNGAAAFSATATFGGNVTVEDFITINMTNTGTGMLMISTEAGAASGPLFVARRTSASPAANDLIGGIAFQGNSSTLVNRAYCQILGQILVATNTSEAGIMQFQTMDVGANATRLIIGAGLYHGAATGGDRGNGSINMDAVYDDQVLLTCIPMQQAFLDRGEIDLAWWDKQVPDKVQPEQRNKFGEIIQHREVHPRKHEVARLFKRLHDEGVDPWRDPDSYFERMRTDEALPGMPTKHEWKHGELSLGRVASRKWLAMELLGVAMMNMHERMKAAGI